MSWVLSGDFLLRKWNLDDRRDDSPKLRWPYTVSGSCSPGSHECSKSAIAANHLQKGHNYHQQSAFLLVCILGVLAFIFSAVSPCDDAIRQEVAPSKNRQLVIQNWKSISQVSRTHSNPSQYVFVLQGLASFGCFPIRRVHSFYVKIGARALLSQSAGRSPPAR